MIKIIISIIFSIFVSVTQAQKFAITGSDLLAYGGYAVSGVVWGAREAYHSDPRVFEKNWGVNDTSFFGSRAWERNYVGGVYYPGARLKTPEFLNVTRDFWHCSGLVTVSAYGLSTSIIYSRKEKFLHKLIKTGIGFGVRSAAASITYNSLRKKS